VLVGVTVMEQWRSAAGSAKESATAARQQRVRDRPLYPDAGPMTSRWLSDHHRQMLLAAEAGRVAAS
jgi:hypothetical protein